LNPESASRAAPGRSAVGHDDRDTVSRLLGRVPSGAFTVAVRRTDGTPAVIENSPLLDDGRPMPTLYWLVDPTLREAVSRLEASGGVRSAAEAVPEAAVAQAHARYAALRDLELPADHRGPVPSGGVGGTRRGVKCLHAHLAWYLAGGDDSVGRWTAEQLEVRTADFMVESSVMAGHSGAVGAVDCGTNSTRLIIVAPDGTVLDRQMRITRLGEGVDSSRRLSPAAIDRTLSVLRDYRRSMDKQAVVRTRVVATSAARDAVNAEEFMAAAASVMGVRPEIVSGEEEGRLSFAGATAHLPPSLAGPGPVLVVDIGGGSTELVVGHARPGSTAVPEVAIRSLDMGCVRVSERFLHHDPPSPEDMTTARASVKEEIVAARAALPALEPDGLVVGLAGTVSTLVCLKRGISVYDRARVHHAELRGDDVERWLKILSSEDARARMKRPGMTEGRQDVIVGGVLVLAVVMEVFGADLCLVSEDDILDGMAADLLEEGRTAGN
jgi:exopolyphosphatase / guanosine-5'-triphosphate,3'-diphosphate pyrophosphatase